MATTAEVKSVEDVLKSSEKDEVKFGLLVGLIEGGQVSNKDVVDTVLHLVSVRTCRLSLLTSVFT